MQQGDGGGLALQSGDMDEHLAVCFVFHALGKSLLHGLLIDFHRFRQVLLCGGEVFHGSWVDVLQEGQHIDPHFVAGVGVFHVGVVGHIVLPDALQMGEDVLSCQAEQRAHHCSVSWLHAAEPLDACASCGIEQ